MNRSQDYYIAQGIIAMLIAGCPLVALVFFAPNKLLSYTLDWLSYTLLLVSTWHFVTRQFIKRMLLNQKFYRALVVLSAVIISSAILYLPSYLLSLIWYQAADDQKQLITMLTKLNIFLTIVWTIGYVSAQAIREKASLETSLKKQSLKMLTQQLQPSFLYQCLDNIEQQMGKNTEVASDCITNLAELLRYKLQAGKQDLVELKQELSAVRHMQKLAAAGELEIDCPVDLSEKSITVPPLLVYNLLYSLNLKVSQPLKVEVSLTEHACLLTVSGFSYQPRLIIKRIKSNYAEFFASQAELNYRQKLLTLTISL